MPVNVTYYFNNIIYLYSSYINSLIFSLVIQFYPKGKEDEKTEKSKRKDAKNQIEILSKSVELSNDAIITTTIDGIITNWNRGAKLIYGYLAEEVLEITISILDPPFLIGKTIELNEFIKSEDQINDYETSQLRKDSTIINTLLALSPIFDDSENLIAILIIARDITKIKKTEEKLIKTEELYRITTKQIRQIIYSYNLITDKYSLVGAIKEVTEYNFEEFQILGKYVWSTRIFPLEGPGIIELFTRKTQLDRFIEKLKFKRKGETFIYIEK